MSLLRRLSVILGLGGSDGAHGGWDSRPACVACDSRNTEALGTEAYRCLDCAHEGGDGLPAYKRAQRRARFEALEPAEARNSARADFEAARDVLTATTAEIARAFRLEPSEDEHDTAEYDASMANVSRGILEATAGVDDAFMKLRRDLDASDWPLQGVSLDDLEELMAAAKLGVPWLEARLHELDA